LNIWDGITSHYIRVCLKHRHGYIHFMSRCNTLTPWKDFVILFYTSIHYWHLILTTGQHHQEPACIKHRRVLTFYIKLYIVLITIVLIYYRYAVMWIKIISYSMLWLFYGSIWSFYYTIYDDYYPSSILNGWCLRWFPMTSIYRKPWEKKLKSKGFFYFLFN